MCDLYLKIYLNEYVLFGTETICGLGFKGES